TLKGKKAMLSITIGGRQAQYSKKGINGYIEDLLFPIHHGMLWYPGISVIPPHIIYEAHNLNETRFEEKMEHFEFRLKTLDSTPILPYRHQNNGDYDETQQLKEELIEDKSGFSIHLNQ